MQADLLAAGKPPVSGDNGFEGNENFARTAARREYGGAAGKPPVPGGEGCPGTRNTYGSKSSKRPTRGTNTVKRVVARGSKGARAAHYARGMRGVCGARKGGILQVAAYKKFPIKC